MNARWLIGVAVAVGVMGLMASVGQAAKLALSVETAESTILDPGHTSIEFQVYGNIENLDANEVNDGMLQTMFKLVSTGPLLGDMTFTRNTSLFNYTGSSDGTIVDLDGDTDLDVGANDPNLPGGWIVTIATTFSNPQMGHDNWLLGTGTFTLTGAPVLGQSAMLTVAPVNRTTGSTSAKQYHRGTSDGLSFQLAGANVGTENLTVEFVPEPMTLALLAVGGLLTLRRRRR